MIDNQNVKCGMRLKLFREYLGYTQTFFAKSIGIAQPYLAQMENGQRNVSHDTLLIIANCYKVLSLDWLLTGRGSMLIDTPPISALPPALRSDATPVSGSRTRVLHLPNTVAWGGDVVNIDDYLSDVEEWSIPRLDLGGTLYSFVARGNSMEPTIRANDLLVCEPPISHVEQIEHNSIYVVASAGSVRVKRLRHAEQSKAVILISDNLAYGDERIDEGQFTALRVRYRISDVRDFF